MAEVDIGRTAGIFCGQTFKVLCVAEAGRTIGILGSEGCWGLPVLFCPEEEVLVEGILLGSWPCMLVESSIRARVLGLGTCRTTALPESTCCVTGVWGYTHVHISHGTGTWVSGFTIVTLARPRDDKVQ